MREKRKNAGRNAALCLLVLLIAALAFLWSYAEKNGYFPWSAASSDENTQNKLSVHFIDVGQGDCTLISYDGFNMLIDAGRPTSDEAIIKYISDLNVKGLDLIAATHPDSDHIGAMSEVIDAFGTQVFWLGGAAEGEAPDSVSYENMINSLKAAKIEPVFPKSGDTFEYKELRLEVLSPLGEYDNSNDGSLVIKLSFGKVGFLFMGDASKAVENKLLNSGLDLSADVLKVGHHGSNGSSGEAFLSAVHPKLTVISVGKSNTLGLPHKDVLERIEQSGSACLRTDKSGSITVTTDGNAISLFYEKNT